MKSEEVRSICFECHSRCGVLLEVKEGKLAGIKGDGKHPFSRGYICPKGRACMEIIYHPDRIRMPLRKTKGKSGSFQEISWDEALDIIAGRLVETREKWGAESVVFGSGTTRGMAPYLNRFLTLFGSPNFMAPSNMSGGPVVMGSGATCGFGLVDPDYAGSRCILLWAHNPEASWPGLYMNDIREGIKSGAKLIVVDPRRTNLAGKADHWLMVRPGTDVALALGFINIIIENELYDREFVEKWTSGFERLREHVSEYTLKRCSEITWLSEDEILSAASAFGQARPASIGAGMAGVCQANDAFDLTRALTILSAITGNLDVPGGNLRCIAPTHKRSCYGSAFDAYLNLPKEQAKKKLGIDKYPLMGFIPIPSPPQVVWPAVEEGKPYPVKLLGLFANNAVCAYPNSVRVKNVLGSLDFLFAVDYFHTPTTELADIVLPPAHWTERDDVEDLLMKNHVFCQQKAVEPVPECRDEKEILIGLARRINMEGFWSSTEEALNYRLKPAGIDLSRFKKTGRLSVPFTYRHYEKKGRFNTPSGKVELYADYLKAMGISPLPVFREPHESPVNSPDLYREYPLVLTTGGRNIAFYHSSHRNIPSLKKRYPDPELQIHPQTAADYGINDGEWVYLATPKGKVEIRVKFFEGIHPKVVHSPHGFWYGVEDGWKRLNINYVTNDEPLCPVTASVPIKALLCRIERRKI